MRFLYGDTEPFPEQYDLLAALEAFLANAARAVQLDADVRAIRDAAAAAEAARAKSVGALEQFHAERTMSLAKHAAVDTEAAVVEYARQLSEFAAKIVEAHTAQSAQIGETATQKCDAEIEQRRTELRTALAAFLRLVRLPVTSSSYSMRIRDGHNELTATLRSPDSIAMTFVVAVRETPAWQTPRKVADFVKGIALPVGVRRSWFSKGVQNEMASIDDHVIGGFEIDEGGAEIRLRRKSSDKDTLIFNLRTGADGAEIAEVHHPEDAEAEGLGTALDAEARAQVERLRVAVRDAAAEAAGHRERVLAVQMGEDDVVAADKTKAFVDCVVKQIAPAVLEVARRSPNAAELSLKAENESGRREELYVKKSRLLRHLEPLAAPEREIFAALILAMGAGAITPAPPSVVPTPPKSAPNVAPPSSAPATTSTGARPPAASTPDEKGWDVEVPR
jgi:hypothetical protein